MMTRYHVINRLNGKKFGDYGIQSAAQERADVLNASSSAIIGGPVYQVRTIQTDKIPNASGELNPNAGEEAPAGERKVMEDPGTRGLWVIIWDGQLCSPTFNSKGAADICLGMYRDGVRKPELRKEAAR